MGAGISQEGVAGGISQEGVAGAGKGDKSDKRQREGKGEV